MTAAPLPKLIIAVDGPAGVGKSTIASRLARKLGYVNLESGAMYRALALKAIEWDVSFDDETALLKLARNSRIELEPSHRRKPRTARWARRHAARPRDRRHRGRIPRVGSPPGPGVDGRPPA